MKLETRAGANRQRHKLNLELELRLKIQSATELAQQNKKLLLAEWAAQVAEKHSRVTLHVHPLVAESLTVSDVGVGAASSLSIVRER